MPCGSKRVRRINFPACGSRVAGQTGHGSRGKKGTRCGRDATEFLRVKCLYGNYEHNFENNKQVQGNGIAPHGLLWTSSKTLARFVVISHFTASGRDIRAAKKWTSCACSVKSNTTWSKPMVSSCFVPKPPQLGVQIAHSAGRPGLSVDHRLLPHIDLLDDGFSYSVRISRM
jgi:hypothetical protein